MRTNVFRLAAALGAAAFAIIVLVTPLGGNTQPVLASQEVEPQSISRPFTQTISWMRQADRLLRPDSGAYVFLSTPVAFNWGFGNDQVIGELDAEGLGINVVVPPNVSQGRMAWCPEDQCVVFAKNNQLYVVGSLTAITASLDLVGASPFISGTTLLWTATDNFGHDQIQTAQITVTADTFQLGPQAQLSFSDLGCNNPTMLGERVFATCNFPGGEIRTAEIAVGGVPTPVTNPGSLYPSFYGDKLIYQNTSNPQGIVVRDLNGPLDPTMVLLGTGWLQPQCSDMGCVALWKSGTTSRIFQFDMSGVITSLLTYDGSEAFSNPVPSHTPWFIPWPIDGFTASKSAWVITAGDSISFDASWYMGSQPIEVQWSFTDGYTASGLEISRMITVAGDYTGIATACNSVGCVQSYAGFQVLPDVAAEVRVAPSQVITPAGLEAQFFAITFDRFGNQITGLSNSDYTWQNARPNGQAMFTVAGTYSVTATYAGVQDAANMTVVPGQVFALAITPTPVTVDEGSTTCFEAVGTDWYGNVFTLPSTAPVDWTAQYVGSFNGSCYTAPDNIDFPTSVTIRAFLRQGAGPVAYHTFTVMPVVPPPPVLDKKLYLPFIIN